MDLNERFESVPGLKTRKGAQARLNKVLNSIGDTSWRTKDHGIREQVDTVVLQKEDGTYLPIAFPNSGASWMVGLFAHNGVCAYMQD